MPVAARRRDVDIAGRGYYHGAGDILVRPPSMTTFGPEAAPGLPSCHRGRGLYAPVVDLLLEHPERPATRMTPGYHDKSVPRFTLCSLCPVVAVGIEDRFGSMRMLKGRSRCGGKFSLSGHWRGSPTASTGDAPAVVAIRRCRWNTNLPLSSGGTVNYSLPLHILTVYDDATIADSYRAVPVCDQGCRWSRGDGITTRTRFSTVPRRHRCIPACGHPSRETGLPGGAGHLSQVRGFDISNISFVEGDWADRHRPRWCPPGGHRRAEHRGADPPPWCGCILHPTAMSIISVGARVTTQADAWTREGGGAGAGGSPRTPLHRKHLRRLGDAPLRSYMYGTMLARDAPGGVGCGLRAKTLSTGRSSCRRSTSPRPGRPTIDGVEIEFEWPRADPCGNALLFPALPRVVHIAL